ncbi:MAG TPA: DEAD/DEAH box helicase [Dehalococcoidia bacterium]|nr:DEAD/DEAH box helicase [Dehalococcoidia bacterium]HIN25191.1 DEAD/DEAH box helicase [Dehalococcoidia bacterium]
MSFKEFSLHPQVLAGVESVGYTTPTPIQEQAIPVALQGRDLLGLAQTGTGKTAAFALPILHHLATTPPKRGIRCLVLAPTRELAEQILQAFRELGQHLGIRSIAIYGGVSKGPQLAGIRRGAQIVVACPGRLLDHMSQKDINLSQVEILVLDEADTMCDMGFLPDVRRILDQVPVERQTLFFSATMPTEIRSLAVKILKDPEMVQIGAIAPAKTVSHALYPVPDKLKRDLLLALLQQTPTGRALVFTRTKHRARTLALELAKKSFRVAALQGNMSQNARQQAMDGFRAGKFDIMVATDIAAHGIDVPEVSHVINFDFPNTADTYLHRIGRTGRAEHTGEAFTFAGADDANMVREVERELDMKIERRRLPGFDYGDFTPEEQFREDRMGLRRAGGQSNGGRAGRSTRDSGLRNGRNGQNNAQNSRQNNSRRNGASNNGSQAGQGAPSDPRTDSNNGNRNGQTAAPAPRTGASNGRRSEQPVGRTSRTGASNGRHSEQPVGGFSRTDSSNGRSPGQILGRPPISEAESRRRSGQLLGRSTSPDSSNGRRRAPSQGTPSFSPRPPRPGKPGKPRGLRRSVPRH